MSSRGGSRYPSAFGHTPSYRSYSSIPDASVSDLTRDLTRDLGMSASGLGSSLNKDYSGVSAFGRPTATSLLAADDLRFPSTP